MKHLSEVVLLKLLVATSAFVGNQKWMPLLRQLDRNPTQTSNDPLSPLYTLETIEQRVDNFDPQNLATYQQRYYINEENYISGGPLFVFLGGEYDITLFRVPESMMLDMAREHRGYMFYLEHRYYGASHPTANVTDANLRWLTPDQALADVAHFLGMIKQRYAATDSPVVVIGQHYSGSLAIWLRQRYPHLVDIVWASSAPLVSHINHMEYKQLAAQTYRELGGDACYDRLNDGFAQMEQLVAAGEMQAMADIFHLCKPLETRQDQAIFFSQLAETFSVFVQISGYFSIPSVCRIIESPENPVHGLGELFALLLTEECIDFNYEWYINQVRSSEWDADVVVANYRQSIYQMCMQLGWFHTSDAGEEQPFGTMFPIAFFEEMCNDVFGEMHLLLELNSKRLNIAFGGMRPNVTNAIFTHGSIDPWRTLGVMADMHDSALAIVIEGESHSKDLGSIHKNDSPALFEAKEAVLQIVRNWLRTI